MKKIVVIGGGTGTFMLLKGLKKYTSELTAVFTMFDSGGSTGKLRDEFGYLPPGDIRRGIIALAPEDSSTKTLRDLFTYRFSKGNGLEGHNFGNLLLTALKEITGDELAAVYEASKLFNIKGRVLPVTLDNTHLSAELEDGQIIAGETNIDIPKHNTNLRIKRIFLNSKAHLLPDVAEAIEEADIIVIGPGDLFSSVIPNLLVEGMAEAIKKSRAKKVFVCNVMTKNGETNNFTASDFIETMESYIGKGVLTHFIVNDKKCSDELLEKYAEENAAQVIVDDKLMNITGVNIVKGDFINEKEIVRHESSKIARAIIELS